MSRCAAKLGTFYQPDLHRQKITIVMSDKLQLPDKLFGIFALRTAKRPTRRRFIGWMATFGLFLVAPVEAVFGQEGGCTRDPNNSCDNCCGGAVGVHYNSCNQRCCENPITNTSGSWFPCAIAQQCCGPSCVALWQEVWDPNSHSTQYAQVQCCQYNCTATCGYAPYTYPCNCQGGGGYYSYPGVISQGCCGDGIYNACTQGCCDGKTTYNLSTQCCCGVGNGTVMPCTGSGPLPNCP